MAEKILSDSREKSQSKKKVHIMVSSAGHVRERAIGSTTSNEHIYWIKSHVYLLKKDFTQAAEILKKALEAAPDFTEAQDVLKSIEMGQTIK